MSGRVVVGYDGSPASLAALEWAKDLARRRGSAIELVLAWESMSPWLTPPVREAEERDIAERAERVLQAGLTDDGGDVRIDPTLVQGPAASVLVERAADADLLVVGAHGDRGVLPGVGSVTARCVVWSTVPTVVVPASPVPDGPVVVGADGSTVGARALEAALRLTGPDQPVRVVHTWAVPAAAGMEALALDPDVLAEGGRSILERVVEGLDDDDRQRVSTELRHGEPRRVLADEGKDASLVVVGTRGHSVILHRLLGSTATYLVHEHPTAVMVVPAEPTTEDQAG